MDLRFWRKKWLLTAVIVTVVLVAFALFLTTLKFDYDRENDAVMQYFSSQPGMSNAFAELESLTPFDAVVLCWVGLRAGCERMEPWGSNRSLPVERNCAISGFHEALLGQLGGSAIRQVGFT